MPHATSFIVQAMFFSTYYKYTQLNRKTYRTIQNPNSVTLIIIPSELNENTPSLKLQQHPHLVWYDP